MSNYTQNSSTSVLGSSYFQGLINPWDEYVLIPYSDNQSVMVVGNCDGVDGNVVSFKDSTVYIVERSGNYGSTYNTRFFTEDQTTVTIQEPYYTYSNVYDSSPVLNCTSANSVAAYFVVFCCLVFIVNQVIGNVIKSVIKEILP